MLRTVEPRVRRERSAEEDEATPAPDMLCVEGEAGGKRCECELEKEGEKKKENKFSVIGSRET